jgi:hypothetical protein
MKAAALSKSGLGVAQLPSDVPQGAAAVVALVAMPQEAPERGQLEKVSQ